MLLQQTVFLAVQEPEHEQECSAVDACAHLHFVLVHPRFGRPRKRDGNLQLQSLQQSLPFYAQRTAADTVANEAACRYLRQIALYGWAGFFSLSERRRTSKLGDLAHAIIVQTARWPQSESPNALPFRQENADGSTYR